MPSWPLAPTKSKVNALLSTTNIWKIFLDAYLAACKSSGLDDKVVDGQLHVISVGLARLGELLAQVLADFQCVVNVQIDRQVVVRYGLLRLCETLGRHGSVVVDGRVLVVACRAGSGGTGGGGGAWCLRWRATNIVQDILSSNLIIWAGGANL
jgi:hypothetical protein